MVRKILLSLIAVLGLCVYGFAQNRQVSGKVADASGKPQSVTACKVGFRRIEIKNSKLLLLPILF